MSKKITRKRKPVGRPSRYKPSYCKLLVEHMALGHSAISFCNRIGLSKAQFHVWLDKYPEFKDAYSHAKVACLAKWEDMGLDYVIEKTTRTDKDGNITVTEKINSALYALHMANRHQWRSATREIETKVTGEIEHKIKPVTQKELREVIEMDPFIDVKKLTEAKETEES